jgi:hypothetical protein
METILLDLVIFATICWLSVLLAPWRPWLAGETLEPGLHDDADDLTVLIPTRNEAESILVRHDDRLLAHLALLPSHRQLGLAFPLHRNALSRHDLDLGPALLARRTQPLEGPGLRDARGMMPEQPWIESSDGA